jgi:3',5'-cyclic AMP phosphodiesterase CpdA
MRGFALLLLALCACGQPAPRARAPRFEQPTPDAPRAPDAPRTHGPTVAGTLTFGAIADCQYADQPDRGVRMYRRSPDKLREAVAAIDAARPAFTIHLGDFTDDLWESFDVVAPIYRSLAAPAHHVLGNHEYSVPDARKERVPGRMGIPQRYRDFSANGWRFVILDGNDVSLHAFAAGSDAQTSAREFRDAHAPDGGDSCGALGLVQMLWLDTVLAEADAAGESAVVMCHFPLLPLSDGLWNAGEVLAILREHPSVKMYLAGHNHAGSYVEMHGIHFLTLHGMLDTEENAFAVITLTRGEIGVDGHGRVPDRTLAIR